MSEITIKDGKAPNPSVKKKSKVGLVIGIILVVIILLPIIAVVIVYLLINDRTHVDVPYKQNYKPEDVINEILVDSLDKTRENKRMTFALAESHVNQIVQDTLRKHSDVREFVPTAYVQAENGNFDFYAEVNVKNFVYTRVCLKTKLTIDNDNLVFKINEVKAGNLGLNFLVNIGLSKLGVSEEDINKTLKESGLNMKISFENLSITYPLANFYSDVMKAVSDAIGDSEYMAIFKEIISIDDLRTISATNKNLFALDVELEALKTTYATLDILEYEIPSGYFDIIMPTIISDLKELLDASIVNEADAVTVANYFLGGDVLLNDSEKAIINNYKSNATFNSKESARYDYSSDISESMKNKAVAQIISQFPLGSHVEVKYSTDDLDEMFASATQLGKMTLLLRDLNKGVSDTKDYKINYVNIERITTVIKDNNIYFVINLNLNGQSINVTLKTTKLDGEHGFGVLKLKLKDLYLGDLSISDEAKEKFIEIIKNAMNSGSFSNLFSFDDEGCIVLNLKGTLDENGVMEALGYSTSYSFESNTNLEAGELVINADK